MPEAETSMRGVKPRRLSISGVLRRRLFSEANAKLCCPERAHKLWEDVNGKAERSKKIGAMRLGVSCSALLGLILILNIVTRISQSSAQRKYMGMGRS
jgi:hypothetical protein